ncbi:MAG: hypothetical protein HY957_08765 [Nitrospirae bacterium]|nr:hypothetical protein [Nitrospirota bacterium]
MKHVHKYETISHHGIISELMDLGIKAAEIRKCKKCQHEMTFVLTPKGEWVPLFDDREADDQDILMA